MEWEEYGGEIWMGSYAEGYEEVVCAGGGGLLRRTNKSKVKKMDLFFLAGNIFVSITCKVDYRASHIHLR